ncbi:restriction endonuclease subunit S [Pelosinus sp. UFO1]|uniref:restriction endonuclease subunit S n=1 Tax=Pelosinus sp. UFO1 TaxID=484770 RepID=UPI0004D17C0B|nr:restriction endonuclease subunit S [Pelosinus sp. UFO1]AIF53544.1 N-6 DNA methylase [Pelosinus sp. UFO1]
MKLKNIEIKSFIKALGFLSQEGDKDVFYKNYPHHKNYFIKVNFETEKIEYGTEINLGDLTTSNFDHSENFVVLECVDRLLLKGYPPECLSLEHKWPMGRNEKGKLDILVFDSDKKAFLMIECKTWGEEYEKEKKKMLRDGGQLFSYYVQSKATQYLCLYASRLKNSCIEFVNDIIIVDEQWRALNDQKEIFDYWSKNFKDNGIFDEWANAYHVEIKALIRARLKELSSDDSGRIYNQFAEILRHNVVSDKPNAFNKILNLFICKIIDEDKNETEEVDFQWLENDTNESLQIRLNDLYREGMKRFLDIEVTDYSNTDLDDKLYNINEIEIKKQIKDMFLQIRLQKNPEFAFKEVYNNQSFIDNGTVVKEIVELLQPYQFRYGHKQQFLGDFFELLLNTSIKQESGQFFTPVPITKFIISSLPIKEFIANQIQKNEVDILPAAIDYATGSGHFLTEWMDEVQTIIDNFDTAGLRPNATKKIRGWKQDQFEWAKEYVYGIEADYRLVKTTKVSSFLNGDGEAIIIRADGLDHFKKSNDYKGKLKETTKDDPKDNGQFDVLVANPPYSVSAFKNTVKHGRESFELFDRLTEDSSEIECLFIERTKQLLKVGGWAGIILPSSILSNSGIYTAARELILKYFNIKAIAEFGSNTFMATGTNTVTLFLERRANIDHKKIQVAINSFFDNPKDATVNGIEKAFSKYVSEVFEDISFGDYISLIDQKPNDTIQNQELYKDYKNWFAGLTEVKQLKAKNVFKDMNKINQQNELDKLFYQKVFEREQDKMLYFFLAYSQQTVLIKVGEKQSEKDFIGYEFSNRRGHEGIKMYRDENGKATTRLYDETNPLNPEKANSYVYRAFLGEKLDIHKSLNENIFSIDTVQLLDFSKMLFEKNISLNIKKIDVKSKWNLTKISQICETSSGGTPLKSISKYYTNGTIPWVNSGEVRQGIIYETEKKITPLGVDNSSAKLFPKDTVLVAMYGATAGQVGVLGIEATTNQAICGILPSEHVLPLYLYNYLRTQLDNFLSLRSGVARLNISQDIIKNFIIPLPPKDIQEKIIGEIEAIEKKDKEDKEKIDALKKKIENILGSFIEEKVIMEICSISNDKIDPQNNPSETLNYIGLENIESNTGKCIDFNPTIALNIQSTKFVFRKGDILYGKLRPYLNKVWVAEFDGVCSTDILVLKTQQPILLKQIILSKNFVNQSSALMQGTSLPRLRVSDFMSIKVPMPPISEQQKIVSQIKMLEAEIEQIEVRLFGINEEKEIILKKYLE